MKSQKSNFLIWAMTLIISVIVFYVTAPSIEVIQDIEIVNGHAYLALGEFGIRVFNIENPEDPIEVGKFNTLGFAQDLSSNGNQLFVADGDNGILVLDIRDPANLTITWRYGAPVDARAVTLNGDYAYVADAAKGVFILKANQIPPNPDEPYSWVAGKEGMKKVAVQGSHIYGIGLDNMVRIFNVADLSKVKKYEPFSLEAEITDIAVQDATVFVATNGKGIFWFKNPTKDIAGPSGSYGMEGKNIRSIDIAGNTAYLGVSGLGIEILDVGDLSQVGTLAIKDGYPEVTALQYEAGMAFIGDGQRGIKALKIDDDFEIGTVSDPGTQAGIQGSIEDITLVNNFVYMAGCQQGINILYLNENNQVQGQYHVQESSGCVAALDVVRNSLIAAVKDRGIRVYDISENLALPKFVYEIPTDGAAGDVAVKDHYAFVADGNSGLTIIDWELPLDQVIGQAGLGESGEARGVQIYGNYAYVASGNGGLTIINIADPRQPQLVSAQSTPGFARNVYVHPAVIANSEGESNVYAFVVGGSDDNPSGLWVVDVTDPANPRQIGGYQTSESAVDVSIDGRTAYILLEDHGLLTLDIGDPVSPQLKWAQGMEGDYSRIYRSGRKVFVAKKTEGLQLFQIENVEAPGLIFEFDTGALVFQDTVVLDHFVYAVDAERGLWVIDIANPKNPSILKFVDTPGNPRSLELINDKLFLADGGKGIRIYNIENRSNPELAGKFEAMHFALAVAGGGDYCYVANAQAGLVVFNISDPANIVHVASLPTQSAALDIALYGNVLYIAEGVAGVEIVDVSNPQNPTRVAVNNQEFSFGNSLAVKVSNSQKRLFVADGELGLKIFSLENPSNPGLFYTLPSLDRLRDVAPSGNYIYLADSRGGARVLVSVTDNLITELAPIQVSASHVLGMDLAPGKPTETHLIISGEQGGFGIYQVSRKFKFSEKGFAEIPGKSSFKELLFGGTNPQRAALHRYMLIGGVLGFILALNVMRAFLSRIILPVNVRLFSVDLFERLFFYTFGMHGEVVFAEGGKAVSRSEAFSGNGPGFVYVEGNNAVVLEQKAYLPGLFGRILRSLKGEGPRDNLTMRTEGAGIVFTDAGEYDDGNDMFLGGGERVRGVVDLRKQIRFRPGITAQTRDGIDVNNVVFALSSVSEPPDILLVTYIGEEAAENIRVIRKGWQDPGEENSRLYRTEVIKSFDDILDDDDKREVHRFVKKYRQTGQAEPYNYGPPGKPWPPYHLDETRVFSAVTSQPFDVIEKEQKHWAELPAHVAVGIYRELLAKRKYDELYFPMMQGSFPLWKLKEEFNTRLKLQGILAFRFVSRKDGRPLEEDDLWIENDYERFPVQEFKSEKLLRARGLKVIAGGFTELKPSMEELHDHYMFEYLMTPFQHDVITTKADHELQAMRIKNKARAQTQKDLAFTFSKILSGSEHSQEAMALRVFQALETLAADPETKRLLPGDIIKTIRSIRSLLLPGEEFIV